MNEKIAAIETNKLVTISEFLSPICLPKKPAIIDAINGNAKIDNSENLEIEEFLDNFNSEDERKFNRITFSFKLPRTVIKL